MCKVMLWMGFASCRVLCCWKRFIYVRIRFSSDGYWAGIFLRVDIGFIYRHNMRPPTVARRVIFLSISSVGQLLWILNASSVKYLFNYISSIVKYDITMLWVIMFWLIMMTTSRSLADYVCNLAVILLRKMAYRSYRCHRTGCWVDLLINIMVVNRY